MVETILKKSLDCLNTENPDLSYIRGMLEVLLAMQEGKKEKTGDVKVEKASIVIPHVSTAANPILVDEASMMDSQAVAMLKTVEAMTKYD